MLKDLWKKIKIWFFGSHRYTATQTDDIPATLEKSRLYLIGKGGYIWCGVMLCPCGCNEVIHLNLLPEGRPKWTHRFDRNGSITITPSIWRTTGCNSHFFVTAGRIHWCSVSVKHG
jgi:hypothetical protein